MATKWVIATSNPHKVRELRQVLEPLGIAVEDLSMVTRGAELVEPDETGATFMENAKIKAFSYAQQLQVTCLAEDSGLVVDALGGEPGVRSARYAEVTGDRDARDSANNEKLLRKLLGVPDERRTARFVCAMCVADPVGNVIAETEGRFEGVITHAPRGSGGFGYDPLLLLPELGVTSAELPPEEKNRRSHRGQALRQLLEMLKA